MRFLKVRHTDFIFSAIAEETGLLGVIGLLMLIGCLSARGLRAALHAGHCGEDQQAASRAAADEVGRCAPVPVGLLPGIRAVAHSCTLSHR